MTLGASDFCQCALLGLARQSGETTCLSLALRLPFSNNTRLTCWREQGRE
jgi:hypothetical protein